MDDKQIIELYFARNESAIEESSLKYGNYCYSIAYNILASRPDSEECVNDTWLRAWNTIPPQRPNYFKLFLAKITRNLSFDKLREKNSEKRADGDSVTAFEEVEEFLSDTRDLTEELERKEFLKLLNDFLSSLSPRECNIFIRRYFYMASTADIAEMYRLKESNVLVILSRTRKKLREKLEKEGYIV